MKKQTKKMNEVYSYPTIGNWLKETLNMFHISQDHIREEARIGKSQLDALLKGG